MDDEDKKPKRSRKPASEHRAFIPTRRVGRPTIITDELIEMIANKVALGNYIEVAAASVGISKVTLYDWLKRGAKEPGSIYEKFSNAVSEAEAYSETRDIERLEAIGAAGNWQAIAWRLERKNHARWSKIDKQEIKTDQGPVVTFVLPIQDAIEGASVEPAKDVKALLPGDPEGPEED